MSEDRIVDDAVYAPSQVKTSAMTLCWQEWPNPFEGGHLHVNTSRPGAKIFPDRSKGILPRLVNEARRSSHYASRV
jgi:hypothetical protein